ncbi:MAG: bifunctional UDP-N-acetylglucosamine diphosphorylase/glucosamine-1-phosphate N-acetyltransferase GlmU [Castellaniella sp.]
MQTGALNVVILAAGQGKRMASSRPKVLHPLAGRPLLFHVLDSARALNPVRVIVVVGHGADAVRAACAEVPGLGFALQSPPRGTGHAVQQALAQLVTASGSRTLVLYGDVPLVQPATLQALLQAHRGGLTLLTQTLDNPAGYGRIVRDGAGRILAIVEERDADAAQRAITEINTGILLADTALLTNWLGRIDNHNAQNEYYLTDIVGLAVADGVDVQAARPAAAWETLGVNGRAEQARLERIWQGTQAARLMDQGVSLADPARFDLRGELVCGRDVFIDVGCVFEGRVELADGVHVGPHCVLRNTRLEAGARLEAFSHADGAEMGPDSHAGPYARLRPGARLGRDAHVGNFVEIKNTRLGAGSKASHLSYLGDAEIGARVNIGAGTITCNYDGVHKHVTRIDDDAFIGSDTQLVAPVTVGKGATIGAGTTLVRDAPSGQLSLSRSEQKTVPGWSRPKPVS